MASLLERLGVALPIIQAPMAGTSTPAMAAAVTNAGALGSIGVAAVDAGRARTMIEALRAATNGPFNVNVFCHRPATADRVREQAWLEALRPVFASFGAEPPAAIREIYTSFLADPDMLDLLVETKPAVVSFHFGLPSAQADRQAEVGRRDRAADREQISMRRKAGNTTGVDAIVAQGYEAGGHRGVFDPSAPDAQLGVAALTRLLVEKQALPVIAAGAIMDGAGIAAALDLGAQAAQLGTAFVLPRISRPTPSIATPCSATAHL